MTDAEQDIRDWCDELDATAKNMLQHAEHFPPGLPLLAEAQRIAALRVSAAAIDLRAHVERARALAELREREGGQVVEWGAISRLPGYWCAKCARQRHNTRYCPVCKGPISLPPSARSIEPQSGIGAEVLADVVPPTLLGHHGRAEGLAPAQVDRTHLQIFNESPHQLWFRATWSPTERKLSVTIEPMPAAPARHTQAPSRLKP